MTTWPLVPLRELLNPSNSWIRVDQDAEYQLLTVRLHGRGLTERMRVRGSNISGARKRQVRANQLVVARIDARHGAMGIVPPALAGAIVSNDFLPYDIVESRILPAYLGWVTRSKPFVAACERASEGTTNRVRLSEQRFLEIELPLPPVHVQRHITGQLGAAESRITAAIAITDDTERTLTALRAAAAEVELDRLADRGRGVSTLGDAALLVTSGPRNFSARYGPDGMRFYRAQDIEVNHTIGESSAVYVGLAQRELRARTEPGDVLVVITGATIGRCALITERHAAGIVSQHVGLVRLDRTRVLPEFAVLSLVAPKWGGGLLRGQQYGQGKPGLNLANLREIPLPVADLREQEVAIERVAAVVDTVAEASRASQATGLALRRILPGLLESLAG